MVCRKEALMEIYMKVDLYQSALNEKRPFEGQLLEQIKDYYKIGLTWSSNALEGNSLTESETKVLIEDGLTAGGKPLRDSYEAIGHARAYEYMFTLLHEDTITEQDITALHRLFYKEIDGSNAGVYRKEDVFITGSAYPLPKPDDVPEEMAALTDWIGTKKNQYHPVEYAALLHKKFVFIHPFIDGNGRVARLLMNTALIQAGYMMAVIPPVLRNEYISLLERAHKNDRDFIVFITERVIQTQKDMLRLLHIPVPK